MKRATSIAGLVRQNLSLRWNALSSSAKRIVVLGIALVGLVAVQLGSCALCSGSCPLSGATHADSNH